jgi:hypothetical protein
MEMNKNHPKEGSINLNIFCRLNIRLRYVGNIRIMKLMIKSLLKPVKRWFNTHIIQEVPINLSICEFSCKKTYCDQNMWITCQKRNQLINE